jgi:cytochrome P450
LRAQLVANPDLIPRAIEEMMRRYPVPNIARVVREDMDYEGARLKAGEQILVSACMHSMDPAVFADPLTVDFARKDAWKHSSFSHGNHLCIGAPLAMQELRIFHEEWLKRISDFRLDPEAPPVLATGIVHAVESLPLVWNVA